MRVVIKRGRLVRRFVCEFCGQEEAITEDEERVCSNCGLPFADYKEPINEVDPNIEQENKGHVEDLNNENDPNYDVYGRPIVHKDEPVKRKPGRPPKKRGVCSSCATAMRAIHGYTCKIDCSPKSKDDTCSLYIEGKPID